MNDRFKFRAWDECNNKMHYDFQFIKSGDSGNDWIIFQSDKQELNFDKEKNFCINIYPNPYFAQQLKIMQSTGLKDKNGKLIYEGDIIKTSKGIANVEYDNTYAYFGLTNFLTVFSFDNFINEEIEVIGNIYENKELLNENN